MSASKHYSQLTVVAIGEILWDVVGNQRYIGGAPFNFAYNSGALGANASIISRVSADDLGSDLLHRCDNMGVQAGLIQRDESRPSGLVIANQLPDGTTQYEFPDECAWDYISFGARERQLLDDASILAFGTLAQRHPVSRAAILTAISNAPANAMIFFDLNLRPPYFSEEIIVNSLQAAHVVKLNHEELKRLRKIFNLHSDDETALLHLMETYNLKVIVMTLGARGAWAISKNEVASVAHRHVVIADTVGCGDAFGAAFATSLALGHNLQDSLDSANLLGSYVASQPGGTPHYTLEDIERFRIETSDLPQVPVTGVF